MYLVKTLNLTEIKYYFSIARNDSHKKSSMFTDHRCDNYLKFHLLEYNDEPVAMCGIYPFTDKLVRVSDRMFHFPEFRNKGLGINVRYWTDYFKPFQTAWAINNKYTPFHSCEGIARRAAFKQIVDRNPEYVLLDGMYQTCNNNSRECWQSISILRGKEKDMVLPRMEINDVLQTFGR